MRTSLEKKYGSVHSGALCPSVLTASGDCARDECNAAQGGKDSKRFSARRENLVLQNASLSPQDCESPGNFRTNRDDGSISERLPESLATRKIRRVWVCATWLAVSCSSHASAVSRACCWRACGMIFSPSAQISCVSLLGARGRQA